MKNKTATERERERKIVKESERDLRNLFHAGTVARHITCRSEAFIKGMQAVSCQIETEPRERSFK